MGRDGEGGKKEVKVWKGKRFAGPMSNCFLRPCVYINSNSNGNFSSQVLLKAPEAHGA